MNGDNGSSGARARGRELTGRKVLLIAVAAFAVILAANLTMMFAATGTFPGVVVKNSYVESQGWNARTAAQRALGWRVAAGLGDGRLAVRLTDEAGRPVSGVSVRVVVGRPASKAEDRALQLAEKDGLYVAAVDLAPGAWRVEILAESAEGRSFAAEADLHVKAGS